MGSAGNVAGTLLKAGVAGGAIAAGAAVSKFALDGVDKFGSLTAQVREFSRTTGASAEDSSKLTFALKELGIQPDQAEKGFFRLEKTLGNNSDALQKYGVQV